MEWMASAALGVSVVALLFLRSLRARVEALDARLESLEEDLVVAAAAKPD